MTAIRKRNTQPKIIALPNGLRAARKRAGLSQEEVAEKMDLSQQTIGKHERGESPVTIELLVSYAAIYKRDPADLLPGRQSREIPIKGYVGAGQFVAFDDHDSTDGLGMVECPSDLDPARTVAVRVRGDSMAPLIQDGWVLFYSRDPEPDAAAVLGKTCIVKLVGERGQEGDTMVRQVRRGPSLGRFNLVPMNGAIIEDAILEWAAPVKAILPREIAEGRG